MISSPLVGLVFSLFLVLLPVSTVHAVTLDDLYVADVLVTGEGETQLRTGARAGLLQVLVRISGRLDVENSSLVRSALSNPSAFYYQYSYDSTDQKLVVNDQLRDAMLLRLHFEPSAVARLLRDAGMPVWGSNRPGIMMWIAVSDGANRQILGEADQHPILDSIRNQAEQRGLPLILPIMDIEDAGRISVAEVWGGFFDRIKAASVRYSPDVIVTARVQQESASRWSSKWSYLIDGTWQSSETLELSADQLVRDMIDSLGNELAERYSLGSSRNRIRLVVESVATVQDYAALSAYLEKMTPVLSSSIVLLQGDVAEFELEIEGELGQLVELINLDERLLLLDESHGGKLLYRWAE